MGLSITPSTRVASRIALKLLPLAVTPQPQLHWKILLVKRHHCYKMAAPSGGAITIMFESKDTIIAL